MQISKEQLDSNLIQEILFELANLNPPLTLFNTQLMHRALAAIGNPQTKYLVIHLAGTNGKGSTAAFIEAGLLASGYRVGKYTSPYIHHLNECILLNQIQISDQRLVELYLAVKAQLLPLQIYLSAFEMLTLLMFEYFAQEQIQYLVLETGMGGTDDATNVVTSQFSLITNISLEHTQWLGNNLAAIAAHKAGIINSGTTIIADDTPELITAVEAKTSTYFNILAEYKFKTLLKAQTFTTLLHFTQRGSEVVKSVELGLFGHFQALNFLAAYQVLHLLGLSDALIFAAAKATIWPGRLQLIKTYPRVIADAAHNPAGCQQLYNSFHGLAKPNQVVIILSILSDKDQDRMLNWYRKIGATLILCALTNQPRALPPLQLAKFTRGKNFKQVIIINSPLLALRYAERLRPKIILISGSIYLLKNFL